MKQILMAVFLLVLFTNGYAKNLQDESAIYNYNTQLCEIGGTLVQQITDELRNGTDPSELLSLMKKRLPKDQIPTAIDTFNQAKSDVRFNVTRERSKSRFITNCLARDYPAYKFLMDSYAAQFD